MASSSQPDPFWLHPMNSQSSAGETPFERIQAALERFGKTVVKPGPNKVMAQCPVHDDGNPSLSITEDWDRKLLLNCFAGCKTEDVVRALGLEMRDLYMNDHAPQIAPPGRLLHGKKSRAETVRLDSLKTHNKVEGNDTHYEYVDADGVIRFVVVRSPLPEGDKTFRQFHHGANGEVVWNLQNVERIPFGMPELLQHRDQIIHLCEGEKDVVTLRERGLLATSIPKGEYGSESSECFRDRHVVIHQDNDEPGRKEAEGRAEWLAPVAASIRVMTYEKLPAKGDVTDWLEAGNTIDALLGRVNSLPLWSSAVGEADGITWKPFIPLDKPYGPPFPTGYLPEPIRSYVTAVASTMQITDDMAAVAALGALSATVGGRYIVELPAWDEPVHGFFIVAAESGTRKSGTLDLVVKPIREWQKRRNDEEKLRVAEWESCHRRLISVRTNLENPSSRAKSGRDQQSTPDTDLTGAVTALLEHENNRIVSTVVVIDDATPEAATQRLIEQGGALAAIAGESKLLENLSAYRQQPDFDLLLKGHTGEALRIDRKSGEPLSTERACLTLVLMTQPEYIRSLLGKPVGGRGLPQRFLIAFPRDNVGRRLTGRNVPKMPGHLQGEWANILCRLLNQTRPEGQPFTSAHPVPINLSDSATEYLDAFAAWTESSLREVRGDYRGWCNKQVGAAARIAALLHLARADHDLVITGEEMLSGIVISQWFRDHASIMFRMSSSGNAQSASAEVLTWLRGHPEHQVNRADIWSGLRKRTRWDNPKELDEALDTLELHNAVIVQKCETGGRPSKIVFINPDIRTEGGTLVDHEEVTTALDLASYLREKVDDEARQRLIEEVVSQGEEDPHNYSEDGDDVTSAW